MRSIQFDSGTFGSFGIAIAFTGGYMVYAVAKHTAGIRLDPEEEFNGADLAIHRITAAGARIGVVAVWTTLRILSERMPKELFNTILSKADFKHGSKKT